MTAVLRRHGATMAERHGRMVALHFGSPATEAAVCRTTVGIAVRSDRSTLEVLGPARAVDDALDGLVPLGDRVGSTRLTPGLALVCCAAPAAATCRDHLERSEALAVLDVSREHVVIDVTGPLAADLLAEAGVGAPDDPVIVVRKPAAAWELLVVAAQGPA